MDRFVSLYLPDWPTDRIRRTWLTARRRDPLVLTQWRGSACIVAHASPEARGAGVRPGMTLAHAQAVLPSAVFEGHDPSADAASLDMLARWAVRFSPRVGIDTPNGLFLDITGCERLFRGEGNLLNRLVHAMQEAGLSVHAAVASTLGAAWAVSHAGGQAQAIVPADQAYAALSPLPPWALRLDAHLTTQLDALGIHRIETLMMLPRSTLPARFGEAMLLRVDQALGLRSENFQSITPTAGVSADMCFDGCITNWEVVQVAIEQLMDRVIADLKKQCRGAVQLDLVFFGETGAPMKRSALLCSPSNNRRHLLNLLMAQCERLNLSGGIEAVRLTVAESKPMAVEQGDFFEGDARGSQRDAAEILDELAGRLGANAVVRPELIESHRPERAWRPSPVTQADKKPRETAGRSKKSRPDDEPRHTDSLAADVRPLRLLPRPEPIDVFAIVPDQPPSWFRHRGREYRSHHGIGPERIDREWWSDDCGTRDYYRIDTEGGARFWVFYEAESGRWFLHGIFE